MTDLTPSFDEKSPLYQQLYRHIVSLIRAGELREGEKLPSKRALAAHLGLSLTTVERAYGLLLSEGYVESRPRSGCRVCADVRAPGETPPAPPLPRREEEPRLNDCFSTSAVDTSLFPYATWARLSKEAVYQNPELLQRGEAQGDLPLRRALGDFLRQYRGVRCAPEQIVVGAGLEALMWVLLQLLPDGVFALEDPGYAALRRLLDNLGRPYVPIGLDGRGMDAAALGASSANVAYVTPSHQFPLGVTMPVGRRGELLRWAYERPGRWLIEDDYDAEFRYGSRPIPAMQGLDGGEKVIYLGTFSRTLAPAIRVAYLILPPELLEVYRARSGHAACTVSRFEQEALARFLASGAYSRHLRREGLLYRRRRDALVSLLEGRGEIAGADAGLHLLFTVPGGDEGKMVRRAAEEGYRVRGLGEYAIAAPTPPGALVLGFAGLSQEEAPAAVGALLRAVT